MGRRQGRWDAAGPDGEFRRLAGVCIAVLFVLSGAVSVADAPLRKALAELRTGVPASHLTLEITESALMADSTRTLAILTRPHDLGVRASIDDFGTGYSSMAHLKKLPVDELKVDRSFVTHMRTEHGDRMIVQSTVDLGHHLGLTVVAEGVEDDDTWSDLTALGCDVVQGYFLSRPLPADRFTAWLSCSTPLPSRT